MKCPAALGLGLAIVCLAWPAQSQTLSETAAAPTSISYEYSPYEQETIDQELRRLGLSPEPDPEDKTIERIEIVPLVVIEPRDPMPGFLNVFHHTSRQHVIARELLLHVGDRYRKVLADETARNLRDLPQLSVIIVTAARGSSPGKVTLVVITKDVWSLRLNWDVSYTNGGIEQLRLQPSETNLFGMHHQVSIPFKLDPAAVRIGGAYSIPRFTHERLEFYASANLAMRRDTGELDGSFGTLLIRKPLLSTLSRWAWNSQSLWIDDMTRRFVDARLAMFDASVTPQPDNIPFEYRTKRVAHETSATRSFGWAIKHDLTAGGQFSSSDYRTSSVPGVAPEAMAEFERLRVPTPDRRIGPFVQYEGYTTHYLRVLDFETLALQEDYNLGHHVVLRVYPTAEPIGSSRTMIGVLAAAQYTWAVSDGLVRLGVTSQTEAESDRLSDGAVEVDWRVMSPRLGFGRLLTDTLFLYRYRNWLNRQEYLGGDGRLRGYPSNYDVGASVVATNLEFRTRPVDILSLQLGGAAFYDVGDAFDSIDSLQIKQALGFGIRALFPQLDRSVFRADVGFPIVAGSLPAGVSPWTVYVAFGQAFDLASVKAPQSLAMTGE